MKAPTIAVPLIAMLLTGIGHAAPEFTQEQASRVADAIIAHEKIKGSSPLPPVFDPAEGTWTVLLSRGFPGGDTFVIIRDSDGAYMLLSSAGKKLPKFRMSPGVRRAIRLIKREPKPKG